MGYPLQYCQVTLAIMSPQRSKFYNIFWYTPDSTIASPGQDEANDLAVKMLAALTASLPAVLTTADTEARCQVTYYDNAIPWIAEKTQALSGTATDDQCPDFVAVCIQKRTATPGKSGRGRWFLGPVPEVLTDENILPAASVTKYGLVALDWVSPVSDTADHTWSPCLNSRKTSTLHQIIAWGVDVNLASQRGRKFRPI